MRILLIIHQFYPEFCGGTERVALNLAKAAQRSGHYVEVLACAVKPEVSGGSPCEKLAGALRTVWQGVPVTLLPREQLPAGADIGFDTDPKLVEQLLVWMGRGRFDLAHVMHQMRMGSALLAAQRAGLPYLLTLTDFFSACYRINQINMDNRICAGPDAGRRCAKDCLVGVWTGANLLGRYRQGYDLLAAAGVRVCPSDYVADRYRTAFPGLEFAVIPHGIDLLALIGGASAPPKPPTNQGLTLGYVGSVLVQKGLDTVLRALAKVAAPTLKLRVVGGFYGDPAYHLEIKNLAAADPRVELLGQLPQSEVFEILKSLDLLCLPSRVPEAFSLVLQEAATAGVPALVSDLGAPAQRVAKMGGGLVLPTDDVNAWAEAITELAAHPERLAAWRQELVLPLRIEEEAFFYESLYRHLLS
ncbi:MAG: glycosyltransferase family 4 protein [Desulfobulbaceae bacterium]|nr:glycosyltransferase family 4 protein [Desulfobulbaceae bacterium]